MISELLHGAVDHGDAGGLVAAPLLPAITPGGAFLDALLVQLDVESVPDWGSKSQQLGRNLTDASQQPMPQVSNLQPSVPTNEGNDAIAPRRDSTAEAVLFQGQFFPLRKPTADPCSTLVAAVSSAVAGQGLSTEHLPSPIAAPVAVPTRTTPCPAEMVPDVNSIATGSGQATVESSADVSSRHQLRRPALRLNAASQAVTLESNWHADLEHQSPAPSLTEDPLPWQSKQPDSLPLHTAIHEVELPEGCLALVSVNRGESVQSEIDVAAGERGSDGSATAIVPNSVPDNHVSIPIADVSGAARGRPPIDQSSAIPTTPEFTRATTNPSAVARETPPSIQFVPDEPVADAQGRREYSSARLPAGTGSSGQIMAGEAFSIPNVEAPADASPHNRPDHLPSTVQPIRDSQRPDRLLASGTAKLAGFRETNSEVKSLDHIEDGAPDSEVGTEPPRRSPIADARTRTSMIPIESGSARDVRPTTGSIESAAVLLISGENPATTREDTVRIEPNPIVKATEQPGVAPSIPHASTGAESTTGELAFAMGKPAVTAFAGSNMVDQLGETMAAWLARAPNENAVRFELRLDPPELGRVTIRLQKSRGKVTAKLLVTNEAARVAVERELPALQQSLEDAGVNLDEFDLTQHNGRHTDDRYSGDRSDQDWHSTVHWAQGRETDMPQETPVQVDETAAGHVDLEV